MIRVSNSPKSGFTWEGGSSAHLDEKSYTANGIEGKCARTERRQEAIKSPRAVLRLPVPELIGNYGLGVSCDRLRAVATPQEHVRMYGWSR